MKSDKFAFFLIMFFIVSCHNHKKEGVKESDILPPFPVVLDTLGIDRFVHLSDENDSTWVSTSNYGFYYIGEVKDTIFLSTSLNFYPQPLSSEVKATMPKRENPFEKYYIEWNEEKNYKDWTGAHIDIRIDTTTLIARSFPAMLTNRGTDTVFIGYGKHIPMMMEATDSLGNWRPIQETYRYVCGMGVGSIILPPNECVLTLVPVFSGRYKTALRLTLGNNHSLPFTGFIEYWQFEGISY